MLNDEKTKLKLLLAYKICCVYVRSGATTSKLSKASEVPLATVKRSLQMIKKRKKDYLRLLPELGTEEDLDHFQSIIEECSNANKILNKWGIASDLASCSEELEKINEIYRMGDLTINEETRERIKKFKVNGNFSFRQMALMTGVSLDSAYRIAKQDGKPVKKQ